MIFTSYFANLKKIPSDIKPLSISRTTPMGVDCECLAELAPSWRLLKGYKSGLVSKEEYTKHFKEYLETLDFQSIAAKIGDNTVLLCYEKTGDFCHRHIVAEWIKSNGGQCEEYTVTAHI